VRALPFLAAVLVGPALVAGGVLVTPARVVDDELAAGPSLEQLESGLAAMPVVEPAAPGDAVSDPPPAPARRVAEPGRDLTGAPLSAVAVSGADGPPVPQGSGEGRRLVFSRESQRVWAVDGDGVVVRTWLVAGSKFGNDPAGTYRVFTRARWTESFTGGSQLQWFVGFYRTPRDNVIGFHEIPRTSTGLLHGTELLGTRQSSGCIRQATEDAAFVFDWAPEGTTVIIV
jgi:lipoprotein-anchoring transpeptidase ErfK/SrfK